MADSTALRTDHYELTMVEAALASGVAHHPSVFEVHARALPPGRPYGVVGGVGRLLEAIEQFRFRDLEIEYLAARGFLADSTLDWLAEFRFHGSITGYREGELYFPRSPVMTVEAAFAEALVLETLVLSVLNFDSAVASAGARIMSAAGQRPVIEMGGRRTHEDAAMAAARTAWIVGFASSSNLEAGRRYAIPTAGTASHAFTLAYPSERDAFDAQLRSLGLGTTLLVDTFDIPQGIATAVAAARAQGGSGPGAIRIDSGDLAAEAVRARRLLDELGATRTRIIVSGDLDEHALAQLGRAPIDGYGVGTKLVTGSGAPTADFVYKLVAIGDGPGATMLRPVEKRSIDKLTTGGRKLAWRVLDASGRAVGELVLVAAASVQSPAALPGVSLRPLQVLMVSQGATVHTPSLTEVREHHARAKAELTEEALSLTGHSPAFEALGERLEGGRSG